MKHAAIAQLYSMRIDSIHSRRRHNARARATRERPEVERRSVRVISSIDTRVTHA